MGRSDITDIAAYVSKYLMPQVNEQTSDCIRYYRAYVTAAASNGKISVKRPFDDAVQKLAYVPAMENAKVGDQVTVFAFGDSGNSQNCIIVDTGKFANETAVLKSLTVNGNSSISGNLSIDGSLSIGGTDINGYVVASGTSGGWDYIKFANGIAACWRRVAFSGAYIGTQVGNIYMSGMLMGAMAYPFTFAEVPNELVTACCDGKFVWPALASVNTETNASTLRLAAPISYNTSSTAVSGAFSVFTIGRWK